MSKKIDQKRKTHLTQKAVKKSFVFQVKFAKKTVMPELDGNNACLQGEIDTISDLDLNEAVQLK